MLPVIFNNSSKGKVSKVNFLDFLATVFLATGFLAGVFLTVFVFAFPSETKEARLSVPVPASAVGAPDSMETVEFVVGSWLVACLLGFMLLARRGRGRGALWRRCVVLT